LKLVGRRVLVVGASSGVGQGTGLALAAEGAHVALAARRVERLEEAVAQAGENAMAIECDVTDEAACGAMVERAVEAFGGLDAIVYTPGVGVFKPIAEIDADAWRWALETNLIGATVVTRAAIPHLEASQGKAVFVSSIVIDDSPPRPSYAPYVVSKMALETLVRAWQGEHRSVGFTTIAMGDTFTEFGLGHDPEELIPITQRWIAEGYMYGRTMDVASIAAQIVSALASPETVRRIAITPRYGDDDVIKDSIIDRDTSA
jgi:NAD(P)-dependent dehydrogenase (short-subunit alcohol dehydrogenase family)